ncbi:hypothetical protein NUU61_006088 [Penicillium alfredii]|uniref:Pathway-specific nitrogen regulator n=1 Tax=Penicillium alfredii TaxID=1506179 RepID=A0A9W9F0B4_9EURO|nr:uncharacterized protein NUU61_006088 [Penicillium alfredii]KAJ5091218.1 hypothetical protein NUU61_006088 [Penicillium alfredii]
MARLNDDQEDSMVHSTDILSPTPCTPNKQHLTSTLDTPDTHSEADSVRDDASVSVKDYGYQSSASSTRHSSSDIFGREVDDELEQMKSRASSRSSFSSVPASVLVHPYEQQKPIPTIEAHERAGGYTTEEDEASFGGFDGPPPRTIHSIRYREAAFRKPSSVRAMQMHTEDEADSDEFLTPPRRRPGMRSPGSSPLKRSPYYSPTASANKPKPKKEFPLVLLHCNLLPPSLPVPGAANPQNEKILEEVLPSQFWKRWRRLQDKAGSGMLRDRGVLISHPEDVYDMLEERLLESLELQHSRVRNGHFLGHESGPGSETELSEKDESETDGEQGEECPDCGGHALRHGDSNRKWEIRVYAANGLMRAGAWAAAWKEMEKVDVEVGLWLPSDVRRALEKRLSEARMAVAKEEPRSAAMEEHLQFIPTSPPSSIQGHARGISDTSFQPDVAIPRLSATEDRHHPALEVRQGQKQHEVALQTLIVNYIRVLAGDRRNVALVVLSILVAFLAIGSHQRPPPSFDVRPFPREMFESSALPSLSMATMAPVSSSENMVSSASTDILDSTPSVPVPVSETTTPAVKEEASSPSEAVQSSTQTVEPAEAVPEPAVEVPVEFVAEYPVEPEVASPTDSAVEMDAEEAERESPEEPAAPEEAQLETEEVPEETY